MAFGWTKTSGSLPIAVDFGFDRLKLLQVTRGDPPQLVAAGAAQVPDEARHDPAARHAFLADALRQLLQEQPFQGRRAICSIPAFQTLVQNLQVDRSDGEQIDAQIDRYLRQRLNVDPARMVIRRFEVSEAQSAGRSKYEVVCVAASHSVVLRYIQTARRARMDVIGMHCEPMALLQAFAFMHRRTGDELRTTCYIDIGAATTKVVISHGDQLAFAKTIHTAGDQLALAGPGQEQTDQPDALEETGDAADLTDSDIRTCLSADHRRALAALGNEHELDRDRSSAVTTTAVADPPDPQVQVVPAALTDALDCLVDELQLCLRYYQSVYPQWPIDRVVFLGGEARRVATCQHVARQLGISAQLGHPLARLLRPDSVRPPAGVNLRQPQPGWAVPIGLCLCEPNL